MRKLVRSLQVALLALVFAAPGRIGGGEHLRQVAAPSGSDSAAGTAAAPYRTAQGLADSVSGGQTGCLREGTYTEHVKIRRGGSGDSSRVTLRSHPGEEATVVGRMWVARGADYVTVQGLKLNGTNPAVLPSPSINAEHVTFRRNEVTNDNTAICFSVGHTDYGRARSTVIELNRIHRCGVLPAANHDHGIYITAADDTMVRSNWIYDIADRGIQLYPDAQGTTITNT